MNGMRRSELGRKVAGWLAAGLMRWRICPRDNSESAR